MGLRINTNIASINAQRNLESINQRLSDNYRRLSTGLRITSARDDPAGLAMSERLRAQVRSLTQAKRNAADGISLVRTAEGSLDEVSNILVRLRELAVQSANGTVSAKDRETLKQEFTSLVSEVDRIARSTEFNGIKLLDGSATNISLQVGYGISLEADQLNLTLSPSMSSSLGLSTVDIGSAGDNSFAISSLDQAIDNVSSLRGRFGAMENRLESTIRNLGNQVENLTAAESRIRDVDIAREAADLAKNQILQQATVAILAQANQVPQLALRLLG